MKAKRTGTIHCPITFVKSPEFSRLKMMTKDDTPSLLGRIIYLAMAIFESRKFILHDGEIDAICAWHNRGTHFADYLIQIGWAKRRINIVEVTMPSFFLTFDRYSKAAKIRAENAPRDENGRYISMGKERRKPNRVDAEGNPL